MFSGFSSFHISITQPVSQNLAPENTFIYLILCILEPEGDLEDPSFLVSLGKKKINVSAINWISSEILTHKVAKIKFCYFCPGAHGCLS